LETTLTFEAIGYVENELEEISSREQCRSEESRIVLNPEYAEGLRGLEPGKSIMVIFYFHRSIGYDLLQHPRGDESRAKRGVFAIRSSRRPNPIGVTEVELLAIEGNVLRVLGLDAINGTPVLDLKPVPRV
jgi:formylmethanofuran dehydrogenase subunit E